MGGIVGAETLLLLASEQPLPPPSSLNKSTESETGRPLSVESTNFFMFPHIQGLVTFDTPFLGIAPGVVSHGAEEHYKTATTAYGAFSEVAGLFGIGGTKTTSSTVGTASKASTPLALPAATGEVASDDAAATPSWQRWGRYAMFAGAAGAVAAGGAAAFYSQKDRITAGWGWVTSHLEFVGCLARPADLRQRVASLSDLRKDRGIGSVNFYTSLGKAAVSMAGSTSNKNSTSSLLLRVPRAKNRTFCHLPEDFAKDDAMIAAESGLKWITATNDKAVDETTAHIAMFMPRDNPSYFKLAHDAVDVIVRSVDEGWYASATPPQRENRGGRKNQMSTRNGSQKRNAEADNGFMEADDVVVVD
jgi:hypothetical protein